MLSSVSFSIKKTEPSKVVKNQSSDEKKVDYVLELEGKEIKRLANSGPWVRGIYCTHLLCVGTI